MARPQKWQRLLESSKAEALLAVRLFNDPAQSRSLEGFIVHMHIAWLYLFQAKWMKTGKEKEYLVRESDKPIRYKKRDGEPMSQGLDWFVTKEYPGTNSPVRANIEFFIKLRNKIEHRHTGANVALGFLVGGECHSMLLNFEEALVAVGGQRESLAQTLRFPVFIGGFTEKGKGDLLKLTKTLPSDLRTFLADYDNSLDGVVAADPRYCMRLTVLLEAGNRKGDVSMQFVRFADLSDDERATVEKIAGRGIVVQKNRRVPVSNADNLKPREVVNKVGAATPFVFNMNHFIEAWKIGKFRPPSNAPDPAETRSDFCVYDKPHGDYTYTPAYLEYLIRECQTADGFRKITGKSPLAKVVG